jgi:hypothetical protein
MQTIIVEVHKSGATVELVLRAGASSGQAVIVLSDAVEFKKGSESEAGTKPKFQTYRSESGFPPRSLTEEAIVQILREHGGSVKIRDKDTGWNVYDEIAARLGVSVEARQRLTAGTGRTCVATRGRLRPKKSGAGGRHRTHREERMGNLAARREVQARLGVY